ncbi:alpha/beta hydrolase [Microbacterium sp. kSW2-24]|uniref:alpha/beta fold hydrolase n=1 Tax=Microbacterium galbinum TaxID=2851646 RepID=UPI001FFDE745|nr:alpha/beta hydrolase [Microbacterium galbinum]MCK2021764.1 alpha/beta hydrolase [Microbacterium galbinum]
MDLRRRRLVVDGTVFGVVTGTTRHHPQVPTAPVPTVVLVHGIGMSHRYHRRLLRMLSAEARVVAVDLPGFGGLPKPREDVDIGRMARLLIQLLPIVCGGPVILVGHSMGAQWAAEVAHLAPHLVRSLVLIGPVADDEHRSLPAQAFALAVDTAGESPATNALVFADYLRCGVPWYLAQARHMLRYALEDVVGGLLMPVLVIRGLNDPIAGSAWCRRLRDRAVVSHLVEIPGGRHVVHRSEPRAVCSAILDHAGVARARALASDDGER